MPRKITCKSRSPDETDVFVGVQIRRHRIAARMTLSEFGEALGISHQQVQKYEVGTNRVSAGTLYRMAEVLEVPLPLFFPMPENPREDVIVQRDRARAQLREIRKVLEGAA